MPLTLCYLAARTGRPGSELSLAAPTPLLARLTIVPPALLLGAVIAYGGFGLGRDTTPLTHSLRNAEACLQCHRSFDDYGLLDPVPTLCARCHSLEQLSATEGHAGSEASAGDCSRCHAVHGKTREPFLLRPEVAPD
jgi:hypothetical protein